MKHLFLAFTLIACGDKDPETTITSEDTPSTTTPDTTPPTTTPTTVTTTTDPTTPTPTGTGAGDLIVWSSPLAPSVRWNLTAGTYSEVGQFATPSMHGKHAQWSEGGVYIIGDGLGNEYVQDQEATLVFDGKTLSKIDDVWTLRDLDGSNSEPFDAPPNFGIRAAIGGDLVYNCRTEYYQTLNEVFDMSTSPPTLLISVQIDHIDNCKEPIRASDGVFWIVDTQWNDIYVIENGEITNTMAALLLDWDNDDLSLSGVIGPVPGPGIRVYAEQGFANYATGILTADGTLTLDTLIEDHGLFTNTAMADYSGQYIAAPSLDSSDPGMGIIDQNTGELIDFIEGAPGNMASLVTWVGTN